MSNIIYSNSIKVEKILSEIKKWWVDNLHFLADFDNTLTKAFVNWKKSASMVAVLRWEDKTLWEECAQEDIKLFNHYHPIEFDSSIELNEKKIKMVEWWTKSLNLFIKYGLTVDSIKKISQTDKVELRIWADKLINNLSINNIPLIIISASWFWRKSIEFFLKYRNLFLRNIDIISNDFKWDSSWKAIDYLTPIIHSFNKDETVLEQFPDIHNKIVNRKNIILLWDSLGDPHMSDWFEYDNLLKIWFLNYREEENIESYKEKYDIIITWDWDFNILNEYLSEFLT